MQRRRWGGWQHTRQTLEKSPTSKLYTTWAHILSDRNAFSPQGGGERRGPMPLGLFLFFSWSLAPDLRSVKTTLAGNLRSFNNNKVLKNAFYNVWKSQYFLQ